MSAHSFKGRVVIVTGAGGGLGRAYALGFAARGAKVVVNDLGVSTRGDGADSRAADHVVNEIKQAGGEAVANYDSVVDGAKIVKTAMDTWGRVDVVINNAGILRDTSFHKMAEKDWDMIYQVHVKGAYAVTHAAWPIMLKQKFGRVIMVASAAGLYGNFGQAHYSMAKLGIVGFANTLAKEGQKKNVHVNVIAPIAGSRMTETVMPPNLVEALKPEYVTPLLQYLCHEDTKDTGNVFEVGAGWISRVRFQRSKGAFLPLNESFTSEAVAKHWSEVNDFSESTYPTSPQDSFAPIMGNLENKGNKADKSSNRAQPQKKGTLDVGAVLAHRFEPFTSQYVERDVILYALGVGAAVDQLDPKELRFTYEGDADFSVLPTFGVVIPSSALGAILSVPALKFNPMMLLHGEQFMELPNGPLPTSGKLTSQPRISAVYDKGKGALVLLDVTTTDEAGKKVLFNQYSLFIRGLGGFGGDKGPKPQKNAPPANTPPHVVHRQVIPDNQALLYRLSGDYNPLHADPAMAKMGGFNKPILHGLCSFGYSTRAVLKHFCDNDVKAFRSIRVRFTKHVFPGETLITEMWKVGNDIIFRAKVAERGEYVLDNAVVTLNASAGPAAPAAAVAAQTPAAQPAGQNQASAVFDELKKRLSTTPDLVKSVGVVYRFDITSNGKERSWLVDLKHGKGSISEGKEGAKPECVIKMGDSDFVKLMGGKLDAMQAFMAGKIKISGNMMLAQKLDALKSQAAKL